MQLPRMLRPLLSSAAKYSLDFDFFRPVSENRVCLLNCVIRVTLVLVCGERKHFVYRSFARGNASNFKSNRSLCHSVSYTLYKHLCSLASKAFSFAARETRHERHKLSNTLDILMLGEGNHNPMQVMPHTRTKSNDTLLKLLALVCT